MKSKLFERRQQLGLTQRYIADKLGIAVSAYNAYENGQKSCSSKNAEQIAKILKTKVNKIFLPSRFTTCEEKAE